MSKLASEQVLTYRLRNWPVGEIGRQAADEIDRLRAVLEVIAEAEFDMKAKEAIKYIQRMAREALRGKS